MDTVRLWQRNKGVSQLPYALTHCKEVHTDRGDHFITGNLGNMYVKFNNEGVSLQGSLCKYIHGNSLVNMTRQDTRYAVQKLEDEMQMLMVDCKASRVDFGYSLQLDEPPINYLRLMEYLPRHTKLVQPTSTYFTNSMRKINLYDKILEMKSKNQLIPHIFQDKHIMKAEVRYMQIGKQCNRKVTAHDLYEEDFFNQMRNEWIKQMMAIKKVRSTRPNSSNMTADQYKEFIVARYVEEHGMDNVLQDINRHKNIFTNPKAVQRAKESIKNCKYLIESDPLITELENKIYSINNFI